VLREHGLIIKLPGRHRYQLTDKGAALTSTVNSILHADLAKLAKCAA
jgi:predicted transcriptional regulator